MEKTRKMAVVVLMSFVGLVLVLQFSSLAFAESGLFTSLEEKTGIKTTGDVWFRLYPPHNEFDMGLRYEPFDDDVWSSWGTAYCRYSLEADLKLTYNRFFVFFKPFLALGKNKISLEENYTWRADPIGIHLRGGGGYQLTNNLDVFIETSKWRFFGDYEYNSFSSTGPGRMWTCFGIHYKF